MVSKSLNVPNDSKLHCCLLCVLVVFISRTSHSQYPRDAVASIDPLQTRMFTSPWALKREDEEFFMRTLDLVGSIVGQDIKLGTLFYTLNIVTPGSNLSAGARVGGWVVY